MKHVLCAALVVLGSTACASGDAERVSEIRCSVHARDAAREPLRGEDVRLRLPRDEATIERDAVTVRLVALTEQGTRGAVVVAILDERERELARGHYQLGDEVRDQFAGGHGFTGLVVWRDPSTGAEVQFWCSTGEGA